MRFTETLCCSCTGDLHGVPTRCQHLSPFPSCLCLSAKRSKLLSSLWRRGQQGQGGHHRQGWHHVHGAPRSPTWAGHTCGPRRPSGHHHRQVKRQLLEFVVLLSITKCRTQTLFSLTCFLAPLVWLWGQSSAAGLTVRCLFFPHTDSTPLPFPGPPGLPPCRPGWQLQLHVHSLQHPEKL